MLDEIWLFGRERCVKQRPTFVPSWVYASGGGGVSPKWQFWSCCPLVCSSSSNSAVPLVCCTPHSAVPSPLVCCSNKPPNSTPSHSNLCSSALQDSLYVYNTRVDMEINIEMFLKFVFERITCFLL